VPLKHPEKPKSQVLLGGVDKPLLAIEREMCPLLRDYVAMPLFTGMRHATETMGVKLHHMKWYIDKGIRYMRIWIRADANL
jgi:hypothetical protein